MNIASQWTLYICEHWAYANNPHGRSRSAFNLNLRSAFNLNLRIWSIILDGT